MSSFFGSSMTSMSLVGSGFFSSFFASVSASCSSSIFSLISSLLSIGSIETSGFDAPSLIFLFWLGQAILGSWLFVVGSSPFSSLWTSSEICFAASAFTEIESMPCLTRNSTISGLEPACPQMLVSTPCFLHSRITLDNCFRTAQFISS